MSPHFKSQVGAVILAAGGSSRFGQPKQLVQFRGTTLVRRTVNAAREAGCWPIIVVVGGAAEQVVGELAGMTALTVKNREWQCGIGGSIRCGIKHLLGSAPRVHAAVLLVCDQPFVNADTIRNLLRVWQRDNKSIVASTYAETFGVPALFEHSFFPELLSLPDGVGAKSIILRNREYVAECPFPEGSIDMDTPETYESVARTT